MGQGLNLLAFYRTQRLALNYIDVHAAGKVAPGLFSPGWVSRLTLYYGLNKGGGELAMVPMVHFSVL
jgi:hypothetical protein